jgi:hypothetical protein
MAFGARKPSFTGRPDRAIEITRGPRPPTDQGLAGSDANAVTRIQQVANTESGNLDSLPGEILKDVGLTGKLLRGVNTARYQVACGCIGTVSCAVGLVGFNGIRNLAMRLVPLKHMHDKAHAHPLQEEFLRSLLAGMLASELGTLVRDREQAFYGAMLQNLGQRAGPELRGARPGRDQGPGPTADAAGLHGQAGERPSGARAARCRRTRAQAGSCGRPGFRCIVFCPRDARSNSITGRFGLGDDAEAVAALFRIPLQRPATCSSRCAPRAPTCSLPTPTSRASPRACPCGTAMASTHRLPAAADAAARQGAGADPCRHGCVGPHRAGRKAAGPAAHAAQPGFGCLRAGGLRLLCYTCDGRPEPMFRNESTSAP